MWYYAIKVALSAVVIVAVAEIAKRNSVLAALLAALPLTSLLAFVWMYVDGTEPARIAELSGQIFWLVLPSLILFLLLPILIKQGMGFWSSLAISIVATIVCYLLMLPALRKFGVLL